MVSKGPESSLAEKLAHFNKSGLFEHLSDSLLQTLAENSEWIILKENEVLFRRGDMAYSLYIAVEGNLKVTVAGEDGTEIIAAEIKPPETIGEMQFLTGGKRTATISASKDTKVIKLSREALDELGVKKYEVYQRLNDVIRKRLQFNQLAAILPQLFGTLSKDEIQAIISHAQWVKVKRGDALFYQGDEGNDFYILVNGRFAVEITNENGSRSIVGEIGRGESIGEMALLSNEKRSATITALRDSELFRFDKPDFMDFLKHYPELLMRISRILVERLRQFNKRSEHLVKRGIVTLLAVDKNVPLGEFSRRLSQEMAAISPTLHVNGEKLNQILETPGISQILDDDPNQIRLLAWLNHQDEAYRFTLLEADPTVSNWTKFCLRQSDHIVIVGNAGNGPDLGEVEKYMSREGYDRTVKSSSLVLIHLDGDKQPSGTSRWLEKRNVSMNHHLRWDMEKDFQRIARYLSGTSVGLALSGGGARGFAHIGVIKALEEAGIPIDMVGGTSMGSVVAAEYAMGLDCEQEARRQAKDVTNLIFDMTLPVSSMFSGGGMSRSLMKLFGETCIEDLWLPYFCVSSNMSRAKKKVHHKGPLWRAVLASNAAPGLFPPVVIDGDLHIDGALLSNLPADTMKDFCQGCVIAVDVSPAVDLAENKDYGDKLSGWKIMWSKVNPFNERIEIPDIRTIIQRSGELASIANERKVVQEASNLYLRMPVEKYQLQDYKKGGEIIDCGYQFAKEVLKTWKRKVV